VLPFNVEWAPCAVMRLLFFKFDGAGRPYEVSNHLIWSKHYSLGMRKLPPVVRIEPAASCNLRCLHCPTGLDATPKGVMDLEIFELILSDLAKYGDLVNTVVLYHGGEPLLNPSLDYMIRSISNTSVKKIKMVTNGKMLTSEKSKMLLATGLNEVEISLDSVGPEESDSVRRRSNAAETIQNIQELIALKKRYKSDLLISISSTQFVDDYQIESLSELTPVPEPTWLRARFPDLPIKSTWAIQWPGKLPLNSAVKFPGKVPKPPATCSLLDETVTVRSNGDVVVCCYDLIGMSHMGNVRHSSLSEIWNSQTYSDFRKSFAEANYPEPCKSCSVVTGPQYLGRRETINDLSLGLNQLEAN
jgi:radical SAM protein with 4Fe4S-binding SPASM domain